MKTIRVVTGNEILDNGTVSFKFMFDSKMPKDWIHNADVFGYVKLQAKDDSYFDPFKWAAHVRGETPDAKFIGDDGIPRWGINIFRSGEGFLLAAGWDHEQSTNADHLKETFDSVPDKTILLMHQGALEEFKKVCTLLEIAVESHQFDGLLRTS